MSAPRAELPEFGALPLRLELPVCVRRCEASDLSALEWYGMFSHHRAIIAQAYARQLAGENEMLLAAVAGFPVAQVWIDLEKLRGEHTGVIWALRVFPWLCGLGLGSLLLARAEARLTALGFEQAEIGVENSNPAPERLYLRRGYRHSGAACERYSYVLEDGRQVHATADLRLLRKWLVMPCPDSVR
jgi:ribosomal protein S18 acetylase RimI-like enzyme